MSFEGLDIAIVGPAFIAGLLVLTTHVPLGQEVLKRGIIFIDLAIAQVAGLGVIVAFYFGWEMHGWEVQVAAMLSAFSAALILSIMEKYWAHVHEALIGVIFILAATASILLLADNPQGGEHLKELLIGQILWITWQQLIPVALISAIVLIIWFKFKHLFGHSGFYLLFALAVTSSVQLVGIYLVFASLIIPALGSMRYNRKKSLFLGYIIGALGYATGLMLSSLMDLPSGAVIVWSIAAIALLTKIIR
jgi:zinc/manganese transport system permease protein